MKKFKAILTDFDGTLVNHNCEIGNDVEEMIKKIKSKRIHFSLSTGRAYYQMMKDFLAKHKFSDIHIFCGGGLILDTLNDKILWSQSIDNNFLKIIVDYFQKEKVFFTFETLNHPYMSELIDMPTYADKSQQKNITEFQFDQDIYKIMVSSRINKFAEKKVDRLIKTIKNQSSLIEIFKFRFHNYFGFDITSQKVTKLSALIKYAKILNIAPKEIIAIGDSYNDFPLFLAAGYKIAMSDAPKELKEIADLVVPNESNQGMKEALIKLFEMNLF